MSIQTEITLLQNTKDEIRTAIMEKGVTVYNNDPFSIYPTRIGQISTTAGDRDALFTDILERDITSIEIPEGTSRIDEAVFRYCTQMTTVVIPSTVSFIGYLAFEYCTALTSITCLGTTPATLDGGTFKDTNDCPIYVPTDSVDAYKTAWPPYASRIQAIPVPALKWVSSDGTQEISIACEDLATAGTLTQTDRTNADTGNLMGTVEGSAEIGDCVTTIGLQAFYNCSSLTSVTIPDSVTNIGVYTFAGCEALTSVTIPDSVTTIESYTFNNCSSLTSVNIPSGVYSIGLQAFQGCSSLASISIPDSVTSIGDHAFRNCTSLTSLTIPSGVTSIGGSAFYGCTGLNYITVNSTTPPLMVSGAFNNTNDSPIIVPAASVDAYKAATGWSSYADRIVGEGVAYWTEQSYQCEVDETNKKTGMVTVVEKDTNPTSSTYNQTRTRTYEDLERCNPVSFTKITSLDEATSGKYLIVKTSVNKALNASLIKDTTSTTNGINNTDNMIDVTIENDTITADATIMNAAADYDAINHTLSWTDSNTGITYYLYWSGNGARYAYSGNTQPSMQYPMEATYYTDLGSFSFANSTKMVAYSTNGPRLGFYQPSNTFEANMALFKLN